MTSHMPPGRTAVVRERVLIPSIAAVNDDTDYGRYSGSSRTCAVRLGGVCHDCV